MTMRESTIQGFVSGVQNKIPADIIFRDAAQDSLSFRTINGGIELMAGRAYLGTAGALGAVYGEILAPKFDGTLVHFRKINTKIQYLNGSTWTDIVTGLSTSDYTFATYSSLAGAYVLASGADGLYKIAVANPTSYKNMYVDGTNHYGKILINDQRMFLWDRRDGTPDNTALYLSKIDPQGTNYSTVTNEVLATGDGVTTVFSGTLAQATGLRFVFGITINTNPSSVTARDNFLGVISGTGVTGTINYATGAYTLTFAVAPALATDVRASYQYEDSNSGGLTDFRFTTPTRLAGEGDIIPQAYLGEPIQNVLVFEGKYYSMKKTCVYELDLTTDDTNATNIVYRKDVGIPSFRAAVSTSKGIIFMNTANPSKPELTILQRNPVGGNLEPINITPQFAWENYVYDDCVIDTWNSSIVLSAKQVNSDANDRLFIIDSNQKYSVDISYYGARTFVKDNAGLLFAGDSLTESVYDLFSGVDDLGDSVDNYWISRDETYGKNTQNLLKRVRYLRLKGFIEKDQSYSVFISYDGSEFTEVGTIVGTASYVDLTSQAIGGYQIGTTPIGGATASLAYPYFASIRVRTPKFRTRTIKIVANGLGYVSINYLLDHDILLFEQKLPRRFRQKQHVSLDGTQTDLPTFDS